MENRYTYSSATQSWQAACREVVVVPIGLAVGGGGLVGAAQHNGKRGTVASGPDPISKVRLDGGGNGGRPLGLLPANLRLLGPEGLEPEPEPEL